MQSIISKIDERRSLWLIGLLTFLVIGSVTFLIFKSQQITEFNPAIYLIPKLNAFLNSAVSILLVAGFYFIRKKNFRAHRGAMLAAFIFSSVFLVTYILYHYNAPETKFGDLDHNGLVDAAEKAAAGSLRYVYLFLLMTHIVLAAVIVPLVLTTMYRAFGEQFPRHRKIARITFPLWLYVSVTGVIVYLLISPYYPA